MTFLCRIELFHGKLKVHYHSSPVCFGLGCKNLATIEKIQLGSWFGWPINLSLFLFVRSRLHSEALRFGQRVSPCTILLHSSLSWTDEKLCEHLQIWFSRSNTTKKKELKNCCYVIWKSFKYQTEFYL